MSSPHRTPLADIRATMTALHRDHLARTPSWRYRLNLVELLQQQKDEARREFARLNGWSAHRCSGFEPQQINGGEPQDCLEYLDRDIFDHAIFYRTRGACAAIVGQPYVDKSCRCLDDAADIADRLGLALHVPPVRMASIHLPGGCAFLVFTSREHEIRWLPEQMVAGVSGNCVQRVCVIGRVEP